MFLIKVGRLYLKYKIMKWQEISGQGKNPAVLHKKEDLSYFLKKAFSSAPASAADPPSAQPTGFKPKESK